MRLARRSDDARPPTIRRAPRLLRTRVLPVVCVMALGVALPGGAPAVRAVPISDIRGLDALADLSASSVEGLELRLLGLAERAVDSLAEAKQSGLALGVGDQVADPSRLVTAADEALGIGEVPAVAMQAYGRAQRILAASDPECGLSWWMLAAIGRVESDHGRFGGATLDDEGFTSKSIRGLPLDGTGGVGRVPDTDHGRLDGDAKVDRAMGPMQFIPATWKEVGVDADGDGVRNPDNIFDAATGAGVYLCSGDTDLRDPDQFATALHYYNPSDEYVALVSRLANAYRMGTDATGLGPGGYRDRYDSGGPTDTYGYGGLGGRYRSRFGRPIPGGGFYYLDPYTDLEVELPPFGRPSTPANPATPPASVTLPPPPSNGPPPPPPPVVRPPKPPAAEPAPWLPHPPTTPFPGLERPPTGVEGPGAPSGPPTSEDRPTPPTTTPGTTPPTTTPPASPGTTPPTTSTPPTTTPGTTPPTTATPPATTPPTTGAPPAAPACPTGARVDDPATAIDESKIPVDDPTTPIDESKIPVDDPTTPIDESKIPVDDPTTPIDESKTPVDDPTTPIDESKAPVDDPTTPIDESKAPADGELPPGCPAPVPTPAPTPPAVPPATPPTTVTASRRGPGRGRRRA